MQASCAVVSKKVLGNPKITSSRSAPRSMVTVDRDPEAAYAPPGENEEDPDGIDVMEGLSENPQFNPSTRQGKSYGFGEATKPATATSQLRSSGAR